MRCWIYWPGKSRHPRIDPQNDTRSVANTTRLNEMRNRTMPASAQKSHQQKQQRCDEQEDQREMQIPRGGDGKSCSCDNGNVGRQAQWTLRHQRQQRSRNHPFSDATPPPNESGPAIARK